MKRSFIQYAPNPAEAATAAAQQVIEIANQLGIDPRKARVLSTTKVKGPSTKYVSIIELPGPTDPRTPATGPAAARPSDSEGDGEASSNSSPTKVSQPPVVRGVMPILKKPDEGSALDQPAKASRSRQASRTSAAKSRAKDAIAISKTNPPKAFK